MAIYLQRSAALILMGVCLWAAIFPGCGPRKVPTSEPGRSGMPTGVYDPGTPPEGWEIDLEMLPIYPGAKQFGDKYIFTTLNPVGKVVSYYEEKLTDAEVIKATSSSPVTTFKTELFVLKVRYIELDDKTLITFSKPEE